MQAEMRSRTYRFGVGLEGNALLSTGWGEPERGFVWTEGKAAGLQIPVSAGVHTVAISMWGYVPDSTPVQEVLIFANGLFKGLFCVKDKAVNQIVQETADLAKGLELTFYIPTATSPKRAENSSDERCLGIALALVQIQTVSAS
jgi:hypothetical protein